MVVVGRGSFQWEPSRNDERLRGDRTSGRCHSVGRSGREKCLCAIVFVLCMLLYHNMCTSKISCERNFIGKVYTFRWNVEIEKAIQR